MNHKNLPLIKIITDDEKFSTLLIKNFHEKDANLILLESISKCISLIQNDYNFDLLIIDLDLCDGKTDRKFLEKLLTENEIPIILALDFVKSSNVQFIEALPTFGYIDKNSSKELIFATIKTAIRLRKSYEKYKMLFDNSQEAILVSDDSGNFININYAAASFFELNENTFKNLSVRSLKILGDISPEEKYKNYINKGKEKGIFEFQKKNGDIHIAEYNAIKITDNFHQSIYRDITHERKYEQELKSALHKKSNLMQELQHRIRNSFSLILSMIHLEKETITDKFTLQTLIDVEARIFSLVQLYDLLINTDSEDYISLKDYYNLILHSLNKSILNEKENIKLNISISEHRIPAHQASSWGLIFTELVTNCYKNSFAKDENGFIKIDFQVVNDKLQLSISDNGTIQNIDFDKPESLGFGLSIVKFLSQQIYAKVHFERDNLNHFIVSQI